MKSIKTSKQYIGFDDTWVIILVVPLVGFFVPILFFGASLREGFNSYLPKFLTSLMFTVAYWLSVRAVFLNMRRRFPEHHQVRRRVVYTLALILLVFVVIHLGLGHFHERFIPHADPPDVTDFDYAVASLTIILLVSAIYEGVYLYHRWQESLLEQERLKRENIESQLEGLRNQVNPHFLFNSLNTLVYIIPEDPQRAVQFVRKLSKVYRYVLEIRDRQVIPMAEELQFLDAYIFLVRERFGDNLRIRLDIPDEVRAAQIVPLSLQILFENAIKHNVISAGKPLLLEVFADREGYLVVRNNLQKKQQETASTRVGLQNIRNRFAFFTDTAVEVTESADAFTVRLPLLWAPVNESLHDSVTLAKASDTSE